MEQRVALAEPVTAGKAPARFRTGLVLLVLAASLVWLGIGLLDTLNFTVDDTFISLRYAENMGAGRGIVYNPGERLEGYSNPLWTFMLGGFAAHGWSLQKSDVALLKIAKLVGGGLAVATILLLSGFVLWLGRRREWGSRSELIALAVLCCVATYSFPLWGMAGLETALCSLFVTLALVLHFLALNRLDAGRGAGGLLLAGGVVFGLLPWVRPEQPFVWGLTLAIFLVGAPNRVRRALVASIVPTLILYAALEAWRWSYYHALIPNSVVAKSGGGVVVALIGAKYALAGIGASIGFLALGLCGLPDLLRGRSDWKFVAIFCGVTVLFIAASGGDWMPGFRFFVPVFPMLWTLSVASTLKLLDGSTRLSTAVVAGCIVLFAVATFASGRKAARAEYPFATGLKGIRWSSSSERVALGKEVRRIVPAGKTLATFESGYVPYYCPDIRVMDDSGLNDREIARLPGQHMFKLTSEVFLRRNPDYFLAVMTGGTNTPPSDWITLLRDPRFEQRYERVSESDPTERVMSLAGLHGEVPSEERISYVLYRRKS